MKVFLKMKALSNIIDSIIMKAVFLTIAGMITSITLQILFRVFFNALTWSEEVSRYLLVWSTFLGATLAYKRGMHISVTFFVDLLKNRAKKAIVIMSIFSSIVFFIVVAIYGVKYMGIQATQVSAALRIPMRWIYIVMPTSFIVMIIHGITAILEEIFSEGEVA